MQRFRRTTLITVGCAGVMAGLGLSKIVSVPSSDLWLVILLPAILLIRRRNTASLVMVASLGLSLGLWRGGAYIQKLEFIRSLDGQSVSLVASAASDAVYGKNNQLDFTAGNVRLDDGRQLAGTYKISGFGTNMVYRGDQLKISGKLYPSRGSTQGRVSYAQVSKLATSRNWVTNFSHHFSAGMQNALPEPLSSFGMGLLVGQRVNMPALITTELTAVGLVHIVAVSGYNLTILVRVIQRLRLRSKYQQLVASLALIGLFVSITGFSASIVRAALVSSLSLWAWYYGRKIKPVLLIFFAAALTAMANPFYIWGDLSWYLSFLAFFGVLVIAPLIQRRFFAREPKILTLVILETLSAELMTLPLIMMSFSQLSLVALLANTLLVPLVPAAMLLAAAAAGAGMVAPQLAGWIAWPGRLLLTYMLDVVHILAAIPSVLLRASLSPSLMLSFYGLVLVFILTIYKRGKALNLGVDNTLKDVKI